MEGCVCPVPKADKVCKQGIFPPAVPGIRDETNTSPLPISFFADVRAISSCRACICDFCAAS